MSILLNYDLLTTHYIHSIRLLTGEHPAPNETRAPVSALSVGKNHVLVLPMHWERQGHGTQHISKLMERGPSAAAVVVVAVVDGKSDAVGVVDAHAARC